MYIMFKSQTNQVMKIRSYPYEENKGLWHTDHAIHWALSLSFLNRRIGLRDSLSNRRFVTTKSAKRMSAVLIAKETLINFLGCDSKEHCDISTTYQLPAWERACARLKVEKKWNSDFAENHVVFLIKDTKIKDSWKLGISAEKKARQTPSVQECS